MISGLDRNLQFKYGFYYPNTWGFRQIAPLQQIWEILERIVFRNQDLAFGCTYPGWLWSEFYSNPSLATTSSTPAFKDGCIGRLYKSLSKCGPILGYECCTTNKIDPHNRDMRSGYLTGYPSKMAASLPFFPPHVATALAPLLDLFAETTCPPAVWAGSGMANGLANGPDVTWYDLIQTHHADFVSISTRSNQWMSIHFESLDSPWTSFWTSPRWQPCPMPWGSHHRGFQGILLPEASNFTHQSHEIIKNLVQIGLKAMEYFHSSINLRRSKLCWSDFHGKKVAFAVWNPCFGESLRSSLPHLHWEPGRWNEWDQSL